MKRLAIVSFLSGLVAAGAQTSPNIAGIKPAYAQQVAAVDRAACRDEIRRLQAAGATPLAAVREGMARCNPNAGKTPDPDLARQSPVVKDTIETNRSALAAMKEGRYAAAAALYEHIDANGPAILAEMQQKDLRNRVFTPPTSWRDSADRQLLGLAGIILVTAQKSVGIYYEAKGQDSTAATWYRKANSTAGGHDPVASVRLGFMYAWGRGVQQDREQAMALFGGASPGFMGLQGKKETTWAWLLRSNALPRRPEDVTQEYIDKVRDPQIAGALGIIVAILAAPMPASGGGGGMACLSTMPGPSNNAVTALSGHSCWRPAGLP